MLFRSDRIGDLVVFADEATALGRRRSEHDLSALHGALRSHGGRHEQAIPILLSEPPDEQGRRLIDQGPTNADVHALVLGSP